ncbi:TRAP transporter small permease subunit [Roseitranquillus sediminis]|uniref:TRAP transporter small permease subunit n=1 Tax=Roseitranquillus sediminis TaxID=2809051 RepID=UPI001D0C5492|nr:TRAP transporter small permease [Roseitranquillus sediminis]MBM9593868.1 TRAP transporter small permease [Roseitranquillus sediminis]
MAELVRAALVVAATCVAGIVVIGAWDTVGRLMAKPLLGAVEMTESLLAATIFLALPYAQRQHRHVIVDIVIQSVPRAARRITHFVALVFTFAAFALLFLQSLQGALHSWSVGEVSSGAVAVPIWLAKSLATAGLAIAAVETFRQIVFAIAWPDLESGGDATNPEAAHMGSE